MPELGGHRCRHDGHRVAHDVVPVVFRQRKGRRRPLRQRLAQDIEEPLDQGRAACMQRRRALTMHIQQFDARGQTMNAAAGKTDSSTLAGVLQHVLLRGL